jgi:hypothetical protein
MATHAEQLNGEFDERRVGLDYVSFKVANRAELNR